MPRTSRSPRIERARRSALAAFVALSCLATSCFDSGERWDVGALPSVPSGCTRGAVRCNVDVLERCNPEGTLEHWDTDLDCAAAGLVCAPTLGRCAACAPGSGYCDATTPHLCRGDGSGYDLGHACVAEQGLACRDGQCADLCGQARDRRSNVGCEYWAVDLDNANVGVDTNAAAQQFAVVLSNPQPDISARVVIRQDDTAPGSDGAPFAVASAEIPPLGLRVFKLGPREVDGSPAGEYDTGTATAFTRAAYQITSDVPVVAYQFNPLENVSVFSNDASLLKPVEALGGQGTGLAPAYVVLAWPQTIADTSDPNTDFDQSSHLQLRTFLTIVGTAAGTHVRVTPSADVVGTGDAPAVGLSVPATPTGTALDVTLGAFDVLNLETSDFNADFTGTLIESDRAVAVFSGSEASDAPSFSSLAYRRCCADHLEEQLDPIRTAGRSFVAAVSSSRTRAVAAAGASLGEVPQAEHFRVVAATPAGAHVVTSLPGAEAEFDLVGRGAFRQIDALRDFTLHASAPVLFGSVSPSQDASGVPRGLPGGDPSLLIFPPTEQFRSSYVFLTPDKYSFDFLRIIWPPGAAIVFDSVPLADFPGCDTSPGDGLSAAERGAAAPPFMITRCQLSFPIIDPDAVAPYNVLPGQQNDGVHRLESDRPVGVLVDGFDSYVSYAYAAGTQLETIVPE